MAEPSHTTRPLRVAMVAGEASSDQLGAALIEALRAQRPQLEVCGVGGPKMRAAGCQLLAHSEELAVFGVFEVLEHLPRLWQLRRRLLADIVAWRPDVFIGVDSPGFNLGLAARLKRRGMCTVQYVSPQVWAWRQGRVRIMSRSFDLVMCLLPFEPRFYLGHAVAAEFVGHPLADQIPLQPQREASRRTLGLAADAPVLALLPGSRLGEVQRLGPDFLAAARLLRQRHPALRVVAPMASTAVRARFEQLGAEALGVQLVDGQARVVLQAADVALVASGTATLETLLCGCPMVVAYRLGAMTAWLLRTFRLVRLPYFSLANLLAGEHLVPEFFQEAVRPDSLAEALQHQMTDGPERRQLQQRFRLIHQALCQGGAERAAHAVLELPCLATRWT